MDKTALKNFAIESRKKLIDEIKLNASIIGIGEKEILEPTIKEKDLIGFDLGGGNTKTLIGEDIRKRDTLINEIRNLEGEIGYVKAVEQIVEQTAYTWFNRLIAIRFMEVNNYLPYGVRILSSGEVGNNKPEILNAPFEVDFETPYSEMQKQLINDYMLSPTTNNLVDVYSMILVKICNDMNQYLPDLFEKLDNYIDILYMPKVNDESGVLYNLINNISENDFNIESENGNGQVEIIGWLYQYYNTEPKDKVYARAKSIKIDKTEVPAVTQLFTPDWIVKYMVQNSLGKLWISKIISNDNTLDEKKVAENFGWKYYLPEADEKVIKDATIFYPSTNIEKLTIKDIKFYDPCMGSGHILIYAYEVFMQIYESIGYSKREASKLIIENNLYGLDIDKRAFQLASFSLLMTARKYNRRILQSDISIHMNLFEVNESISIDESLFDELDNENFSCKKNVIELLKKFEDAKEYGSLIRIENKYDFDNMLEYINSYNLLGQLSFSQTRLIPFTKYVMKIIKQAKLLSQKYECVVTNPPYMGNSGMSGRLSKFAKERFPNSKADLFAMFIEDSIFRTENEFFNSLVTMQSWMFLSSYEKMRMNVLQHNEIINLMHMNNNVMGIAFGTNVLTSKKNRIVDAYSGTYHFIKYDNLVDGIPIIFPDKGYRYSVNTQDSFENIPGSPIAYWFDKKFLSNFESKTIKDYATVITGMTTGNNNAYLRFWYEVDKHLIALNYVDINKAMDENKYWIPYSKGGPRNLWYGNNEIIVNWSKKEQFNRSKTTLSELYMKKALTWPFITSGSFSARLLEVGSLWDVAGSPCFFDNEDDLYYCIAFFNTKVADEILKLLNPTINVQAQDIEKVPLIINENDKDHIIEISKESINFKRQLWQERETSLMYNSILGKYFDNEKLESTLYNIENVRKITIDNIFKNELYVNEYFAKLYKYSGNHESYVKKESHVVEISEIISFIVGCIFGRFSTDMYNKVDQDGIIILNDSIELEEDLYGRICEFLTIQYGEENLVENLEFIASKLNNKGANYKEIIKNYLNRDFYKDHLKMYSKRPIYWLYESGKQEGFKALMYMHNYNADTNGLIRTKYLHKVQEQYKNEIEIKKSQLVHESNSAEKTKIEKQLKEYSNKLDETVKYDSDLAILASDRITIDLDDGVVVNHAKIQGEFVNKILAKI